MRWLVASAAAAGGGGASSAAPRTPQRKASQAHDAEREGVLDVRHAKEGQALQHVRARVLD